VLETLSLGPQHGDGSAAHVQQRPTIPRAWKGRCTRGCTHGAGGGWISAWWPIVGSSCDEGWQRNGRAGTRHLTTRADCNERSGVVISAVSLSGGDVLVHVGRGRHDAAEGGDDSGTVDAQFRIMMFDGCPGNVAAPRPVASSSSSYTLEHCC